MRYSFGLVNVLNQKRNIKHLILVRYQLKPWPCSILVGSGLLLCYHYSACNFFFSPQKYIEHANSIEDLSPHVPLYKVMEGNEPCFFKTYFSWDNTKSVVFYFYLAPAVLSDINHTRDISHFFLQGYGFDINCAILSNKFHTLHRFMEIHSRRNSRYCLDCVLR